MKLIKKVVYNVLFYIKLLSFYLKTLTDKTAWVYRKLVIAQKVLDIVNKKCSNELTENIQKLINKDNTVFDGIDAVLVEKKQRFYTFFTIFFDDGGKLSVCFEKPADLSSRPSV